MKLRYVGVPVVCASLLLIAASDLPLRTIKCCSVVFGITLKLLVVNTSWIPQQNNNYTSLFARKAAATSERSTKHTTKTNKQKREKNYAQIGQASEQCYHQRTLKTSALT